METIKKLIKSRTTYMVIALALVNTIPEIKDTLPQSALPYANALLSLATLYFKLNPSQEYKK